MMPERERTMTDDRSDEHEPAPEHCSLSALQRYPVESSPVDPPRHQSREALVAWAQNRIEQARAERRALGREALELEKYRRQAREEYQLAKQEGDQSAMRSAQQYAELASSMFVENIYKIDLIDAHIERWQAWLDGKGLISDARVRELEQIIRRNEQQTREDGAFILDELKGPSSDRRAEASAESIRQRRARERVELRSRRDEIRRHSIAHQTQGPPPPLLEALDTLARAIDVLRQQLIASTTAPATDAWISQRETPLPPRVFCRLCRELRNRSDERAAIRGRVHYLRQSAIDEHLRGAPERRRRRPDVAPVELCAGDRLLAELGGGR
jgi:hypothetical protein